MQPIMAYAKRFLIIGFLCCSTQNVMAIRILEPLRKLYADYCAAQEGKKAAKEERIRQEYARFIALEDEDARIAYNLALAQRQTQEEEKQKEAERSARALTAELRKASSGISDTVEASRDLPTSAGPFNLARAPSYPDADDRSFQIKL